MNKNFLLLASGTVTLMLAACARGPRPLAVSPACAAASDSISKYVSTDALPLAHLLTQPMMLPAPPQLRRGDSVIVEFVVMPDGRPDAGSLEITGPRDPDFNRSVLNFMGASRFMPAQVGGCGVLSKYNLFVFAPPAR